MSLEKAESYLKEAGFLDHVIELKESTATVALAAEALGVEPGMIAKTMSFFAGRTAGMILTEGTAKVDNRKYKDTFHVKAKRSRLSRWRRLPVMRRVGSARLVSRMELKCIWMRA